MNPLTVIQTNLFIFFLGIMPLSCRFYEHRFPEQEDVVMVNVCSIADMGAYVHLLEYNNMEGMICHDGLARGKRAVARLLHENQNKVVHVVHVDANKGD